MDTSETIEDEKTLRDQRAILRRVVEKLSDCAGIDLVELFEEYEGLESAMND